MILRRLRAPLGVTESVEGMLTTSPLKLWTVASDINFREFFEQARRSLGDDLGTFLERWTFALIKPDGIAARKIDDFVRVLSSAGFLPMFATTLRLDRLMMRELWRYEMNLASMQRMDAIDLLLTSCDSLLIMLKDECPSERSACRRLGAFKGPSQAPLREPHHLRSLVGAGNGIFNHVHSSDEPVDMVREIGVLLEPHVRQELLDAVSVSGAPADISEVRDRLYAATPAHALDVEASLARLRDSVARLPAGPARFALEKFCLIARGGSCDWFTAYRIASDIGIDVERWDWITLAAHCSIFDVPGVPKFHKALREVLTSDEVKHSEASYA
ncbi:MAG: nucleoside-diphosphate kinase [Myxococcota bacterium]|nr:nucleoside-diphosphate kinase [Myxococcota bacterium]